MNSHFLWWWLTLYIWRWYIYLYVTYIFVLHHRALCVSWFFIFFSGPQLWRMEVPRLEIKSELLLLAYAIATALPDLSCICYLYHSNIRSLNPLSGARDWTHILMDTSQVVNPLSHSGNSLGKLKVYFFFFFFLFWLHPQHTEVPQARGINLSCGCSNPLGRARDCTCISTVLQSDS